MWVLNHSLLVWVSYPSPEGLSPLSSNVQKCDDSSLHLKEKHKLPHQPVTRTSQLQLLQERKPDPLCNKQMADLLTPTYHFYFLIWGPGRWVSSGLQQLHHDILSIPSFSGHPARCRDGVSTAHFRLLHALRMCVNIYTSFFTVIVLTSGTISQKKRVFIKLICSQDQDHSNNLVLDLMILDSTGA